MRTIKEIYNIKYDGGHLTDDELLFGIDFFKDLSNKLVQLGPVFRLAYQEANNTYTTYYGYAVARKLKLPQDL